MSSFALPTQVEYQMTIYFISRHSGALQWITEQNIHYDVHLTHLENFDLLHAQDVVIGTLPIQLVANLNTQHIRYVHLSMHVPAHLRGVELSSQQLSDCEIQLEEFYVIRP